MYYFEARWMDPALGRFISMDPFPRRAPEIMLSDPQSWNAYSYARNNPVNFTDPSGEVTVNPGDVLDVGFSAKSYGEFLWSGVKSFGAALNGDWNAMAQYQQEGAAAAMAALTDVGFALAPGLVNPKALGLVDDVVGAVKGKVDEAMGATQAQFDIGTHAQTRMAQRGISLEQVGNTINNGESFSYFHEGTWKTGYYSSENGLFVSMVGDKVTTAINDVSSNYISNLKNAKP